MSEKFECFLNYNNNRYDIVINDNLKSVSFNNIYNKIREIIELIFGQKITFETHLFEVMIH
jgi:hypothetical protein